MDKKTYEALKRIIERVKLIIELGFRDLDVKQVENWIDEVAKEYEEEKEHIININVGLEAKNKKEAIKRLADIMREKNFRFWFEGIKEE